MQRISAREFFKHYFTAIQSHSAGWLARQTAQERLLMLSDLMQWELSIPMKHVIWPR